MSCTNCDPEAQTAQTASHRRRQGEASPPRAGQASSLMRPKVDEPKRNATKHGPVGLWILTLKI